MHWSSSSSYSNHLLFLCLRSAISSRRGRCQRGAYWGPSYSTPTSSRPTATARGDIHCSSVQAKTGYSIHTLYTMWSNMVLDYHCLVEDRQFVRLTHRRANQLSREASKERELANGYSQDISGPGFALVGDCKGTCVALLSASVIY